MAEYQTITTAVRPEDHRLSEPEVEETEARIMRAMLFVDSADEGYARNHPRRRSWFGRFNPLAVIARAIMWREIYRDLKGGTDGRAS